MGYRDPSPPAPTTIPYGRFPTSRNELRAAFAISLFVVGGVIAMTHVEFFRCERSDADDLRCEAGSSWLGATTQSQTFDGDQLSTVEWTEYTEDQTKERGHTDLVDASGHRAKVLYGFRDDAHRRHLRLVAFLDDPGRSRLSIERRPAVVVGLLASGLAFFWLLLVIRTTIRTAGRFVVEVDRVRGELRLCAARLRSFRTRTTHPIAGLARVQVEHGYLRRAHHGKGSPGEPAGRLWLVYEDERRRELTPTLLPGSEVHEDLAAQLREELGLKPETRAEEVEGPSRRRLADGGPRGR